jgi:hypothetical protein
MEARSMTTNSSDHLKPLLPGAILALVSILFGFLLGGLFGAAEHSIKGQLSASADAVFDTVYDGDQAQRDKIVAKSWSYLKRAHLHGGAIGAAALAAIVLLGLMGGVGTLERVSSIALGGGALLYSVFWLVAGFTAPGLGSTGEAKEALSFLAILGAGLCLLGLAGTLVSAVRHSLAR